MGKVYKGEHGVQIKVKTGIDLTGVTAYKLHVIKPDGRHLEWHATIQTPATDGILVYTTCHGDLDVAGLYKLHASVTFSDARLKGETALFKVFAEGQ